MCFKSYLCFSGGRQATYIGIYNTSDIEEYITNNLYLCSSGSISADVGDASINFDGALDIGRSNRPLDSVSVYANSFKINGLAPAYTQDFNTFSKSNIFNGETYFNKTLYAYGDVRITAEVTYTNMLTYNTLQPIIPTGYHHVIRQYAYEDYLDFTDNNADDSYNRTVMCMNGKTGVVECPQGLLVQGVDVLACRNVTSGDYGRTYDLSVFLAQTKVSSSWYSMQINGQGHEAQWIQLVTYTYDSSGKPTSGTRGDTLTCVVSATYCHNSEGDSILRVEYNEGKSVGIYHGKHPDKIQLHWS